MKKSNEYKANISRMNEDAVTKRAEEEKKIIGMQHR